jgi:hypothetical protein
LIKCLLMSARVLDQSAGVAGSVESDTALGTEKRFMLQGWVSGSDMVESRLEGRRRWYVGADWVERMLYRFMETRREAGPKKEGAMGDTMGDVKVEEAGEDEAEEEGVVDLGLGLSLSLREECGWVYEYLLRVVEEEEEAGAGEGFNMRGINPAMVVYYWREGGRDTRRCERASKNDRRRRGTQQRRGEGRGRVGVTFGAQSGCA